MMKALVLKEPGGPLHPEEVPMPQPGVGEVLVRVRACGLGLTLVWNRKGRGSRARGAPRQVSPYHRPRDCRRCGGTGPNVTAFKPGRPG